MTWTRARAREKIARVGLRYVRTKPQTTTEQQKAGRIEQNQQHTTDRKGAQFRGPVIFRDALRVADAKVLDRAERRAPTSAALLGRPAAAACPASQTRRGTEEAPGEAASSTIHP